MLVSAQRVPHMDYESVVIPTREIESQRKLQPMGIYASPRP